MTVMLASGGETIRLIRNRDPSALTSYSYSAKLPRSGVRDQPHLEERCGSPNRRWRSRRERGRHQAGVRRQEVQLAAVGSPSRIPAALHRHRIALSGFREAAHFDLESAGAVGGVGDPAPVGGNPRFECLCRHLAGYPLVHRWPASSRSRTAWPRPPTSIQTNRPSCVQPLGFTHALRLSHGFDVTGRHRRGHEIERADPSPLKQRQDAGAIRRPDRMPV